MRVLRFPSRRRLWPIGLWYTTLLTILTALCVINVVLWSLAWALGAPLP